MPLLLTTAQAQTELGLGRSKIDELVARGELDVVRIGRAKRLTMTSLLAYIRRQADSQPNRGARAQPTSLEEIKTNDTRATE